MIKCLSIQQPWAWGIIHGGKRIENRTWPTHHRGPLLIHAGKSVARFGDEGDLFPTLPPYDELPLGAIVGVVELVDCLTRAQALAQHPDQARFIVGHWCWVLWDPRAIGPIKWKGAQSLFSVPESVVSAA